MRAARLGIAAGVAWCALLGLHQGRAGAAPTFHPSTRVVLFTQSTSDPLVARIEAELASVGIAVRRMPMPVDAQLDAVVTREIAAGASAAIRIIPRSRGTEVWTGDTTARVLSRRPSARADVSDAVLSVIALRTVEFLRASLLDVKRRGPGSGGAGVASTGAAASGSGAGVSSGGAASAGSGTAGRGSGESTTGRDGVLADRTAAPADRQQSSAGRAAAAAAGGPGAAPSRDSAASPVSVEVFTGRPGDPAGAPGAEPLLAPAGDDLPWREARQQRERTQASGTRVGPSVDENGRTAESQPRNESEPPPPVSPFANVRKEPRSASPEFQNGSLEVAVGPAVLLSPGGVGPVAGVAAFGRGPVRGRLGWELTALFPLRPAQLTNAAGTVDVTAALFGAAALVRLVRAGPVVADLALGFSTMFLRTSGTGMGASSSAPNTGYRDSAWNACVHARVGAGYRFNRWLAARADVLAGAAGSRTHISSLVTFNGNAADPRSTDLASWGPVFATGTVTLQASW